MRIGGRQREQLRTQRDLAVVQVAELRARLAETVQQRDALKAALERERVALEAVVDNALFAAGAAPVFHPGEARFQPRSLERQQAEAQASGHALSTAEWRRQLEEIDRKAAERDRRGRWTEELQALAQERRAAAAVR